MTASVFVVILDLNCNPNIINQLLLFIHAHQSQRHDSNLLFIACGVTNTILYPRNDLKPAQKQGNEYKLFHDIDSMIIDGLKSVQAGDGFPKISGAISLALTYCNKFRLKNPSLLARILLMSSSKDDPTQHIAIMNSLFAAQRADIKVDVCRLSETPTIYLPQACYLTNGIFYQISDFDHLIHYLLVLIN